MHNHDGGPNGSIYEHGKRLCGGACFLGELCMKGDGDLFYCGMLGGIDWVGHPGPTRLSDCGLRNEGTKLVVFMRRDLGD